MQEWVSYLVLANSLWDLEMAELICDPVCWEDFLGPFLFFCSLPCLIRFDPSPIKEKGKESQTHL